MWLSSSQITIIMFLFSGVAKVQVVADENTDPMSLHLSNCSVGNAVLGQFPVFSVNSCRNRCFIWGFVLKVWMESHLKRNLFQNRGKLQLKLLKSPGQLSKMKIMNPK